MQTCSLPALPVLLGKTFFFPQILSVVWWWWWWWRGGMLISPDSFSLRGEIGRPDGWVLRGCICERVTQETGQPSVPCAGPVKPCRAEWAGGQGRAGWLLPLLLTACSPQHPSLGPCSCSGGPVSPEATGEGEPLTVSRHLCLFLLIAFPGVLRELLRAVTKIGILLGLF